MKRWFDNWNVKYRPYSNGVVYMAGEIKKIESFKHKGSYVIDLPFSLGTKTKYIFYTNNKKEDKRIHKLVMIIDCCFYELTRKKWYQFWKK